MLAAAMAMVALSALAASVAQAEGGPLWIVGSPAKALAAGETRAITSRSEEVYKLKTLSGVIECKVVENAGFLLGGNPGTDYTKITFKECVVEKTEKKCIATGIKPLKAANKGEIIVDAKTVLVYPEGSRTSALDAFAPQGEAGNPNLYAEFELTGTCPEALPEGTKIAVTAAGTELEVKGEKRKCGVLAEVGEANAGGEFVLSKTGVTNKIGLLRFPNPALKTAELWEPSKKEFKKIECKLSAGALGTPIEIGKSQIETVPAEPFGWDE
jgi:hypothetical protein